MNVQSGFSDRISTNYSKGDDFYQLGLSKTCCSPVMSCASFAMTPLASFGSPIEQSSAKAFATPLIRASKSIENGMIYISAEYLDELIEAQASVALIDCRWPYEHAAGTIFNSINIYNARQLHAANLANWDVVVMFCEFSQVRSVRMARHAIKKQNCCVDVFLLAGGFSAYFKNGKHAVGVYVSEASDPSQMEIYNDAGRYTMGVDE